jgi:hypothetical protein
VPDAAALPGAVPALQILFWMLDGVSGPFSSRVTIRLTRRACFDTISVSI